MKSFCYAKLNNSIYSIELYLATYTYILYSLVLMTLKNWGAWGRGYMYVHVHERFHLFMRVCGVILMYTYMYMYVAGAMHSVLVKGSVLFPLKLG